MTEKKEAIKIEKNISQKNPFTFKAIYLGMVHFVLGSLYNLKYIRLIIPKCFIEEETLIIFLVNLIIFLVASLIFLIFGTKYLLKAKNNNENNNLRYIGYIILYFSVLFFSASLITIFKSYLFCPNGSF